MLQSTVGGILLPMAQDWQHEAAIKEYLLE